MLQQYKARWLHVVFLGLILIPTVALYAFNGSYAPTDHFQNVYSFDSYSCPGQVNGALGGNSRTDIVGIRTTMRWNQEHAQNVRNYSSGGEYYTHDITDMSDNLNGWCLWTNFPDPYYDWDDDNGNRKWEESEVVSVNTNFPTQDQYYSVNSYFTRWYEKCSPWWNCWWEHDGGSGTVNITPAVSYWQGWPFNEYQTRYYDSNPVTVSYGADSSPSTRAQAAPMAQAERLISLVLDDGGKYIAVIAIEENRVFLNDLHIRLDTTEEIVDYLDWVSQLTDILTQANLTQADVVVTFDNHISADEFVRFVDEYQIEVSIVRAEYMQITEDSEQQILTGFIRNLPGTDFSLLNESAQNETTVDLTQPHGVVAIYGTAPLEQIINLNQDSRVFLADPITNYISLIAQQHEEVQEALDNAYQAKRDNLYQQAIEAIENREEGSEQSTEDILDVTNIEQIIDEFFDRHPDNVPHVEAKVYDLWNILLR